ncbi:hypothetical protein M2175_003993 [Bradyrhizobium elkanii]|uniref:hypothetical protein n=1 Tax=Bradyrhizobium TaxID=374 RepID=UPI002167E07D|nr:MULTISPECIES: hypothetical protein [Bradyrhizobium]MCS3928962.1 hypothetical protein [Bradyrhizobium elkanii]MCS3969518.1 hypothetical protein [Bradyrhizobium japonicum]
MTTLMGIENSTLKRVAMFGARNLLTPIQLFLVLTGYPVFAEAFRYKLFAEPDVRQTEPDGGVGLGADKRTISSGFVQRDTNTV